MNIDHSEHREILRRIARRVMEEKGFEPDFSPEIDSEVAKIELMLEDGGGVLDLRELIWASIDNDDSRDLDQLTVAQPMAGGGVKILVAVADVDHIVRDGSAVDDRARQNTTSVYTAAEIFPMLPEKLSTDITSLNPGEDRLAVVVEMVVGPDGCLNSSDIYRAWVHNHAKLAYNGVAAWLDGEGEMPEAMADVPGLDENLRIQDRVAQSMKNYRHEQGALSLETIEARPIFSDGTLCDLEVDRKNRAKEIIEDFMISANGVTARYLESKGFPSIRRIVRTPKRWDRIVELAERYGAKLSKSPDARALEEFLIKQRAADPLRFPDLSLSIVKLMGSGEYAAEFPGEAPVGHFGLAVRDYSHSTAPNRRYTDLITQRLIKAALAGEACPYRDDELTELARHCTEQEDDAKRIERQVNKSAAALLLRDRIGEEFDGLITGASSEGTWARLIRIPVEGKVVMGFDGLDVGDRVHVQLLDVDVERGYIDFGVFSCRTYIRFAEDLYLTAHSHSVHTGLSSEHANLISKEDLR